MLRRKWKKFYVLEYIILAVVFLGVHQVMASNLLGGSGTNILWKFDTQGIFNAEVFPSTLSYLDDMDADGIDDVVVGTSLFNRVENFVDVHLLSGQSGTPIWLSRQWDATAVQSLSPMDDLNEDNIEEILIVLEGYHHSGAVKVLSGADGDEILSYATFVDERNINAIPVPTLSSRDLNHDEISDVIVGERTGVVTAFEKSDVIRDHPHPDVIQQKKIQKF